MTMDNTVGSIKMEDLGLSNPTYRSYDKVEVEIDPTVCVGEYSKAICREAARVNPMLFARDPIQDREMFEYASFLLDQRVQSCQGHVPSWNRLKALRIPSFLEYALTTIGVVTDRVYGLEFVPVMKEPPVFTVVEPNGDTTTRPYTIEDALKFSERLAQFADYLSLRRDAMPRKPDGDPEVMSMAIVRNYVCGRSPLSDATKQYMAGFLGLALLKEQTFGALYRIQYDDVNLLISQMSSVRFWETRERARSD